MKRSYTALLIGLAVLAVAGIAALMPRLLTGLSDSSPRAETSDKRWATVAPGRVEPVSGEVRIVASVPAVVDEVLVKVGDRVFAGEPMIRLRDDEARARLAAAETQVLMRRRARADQSVSGRALDRRRAEDAVWNAERAVVDARAAIDRAVADRRAGKGTPADLENARGEMTRGQEKVRQQRAELHQAEPDAPLPTTVEAQLTIARSELQVAEAAVEKLIIRAPIDGSVLQINAKPGEVASASAQQPVVLVGDVSSLRVRAEVDERDAGTLKLGQAVTIRTGALQNKEFAGKVSFIAPLIEAGRASFRGPRSPSDVDVVDVLIDVAEPDPLMTGMKVEAYFQR